MRYFDGKLADIVWQKAANDLIECPEYKPNSRNGETHEILHCVLRIEDPRQRWILSRRPPYNPAFGLVEFIWIITGNNESRVLNYWNPALYKYSGTSDVYHGAYGFRLRHEFGVDQLKRAFNALSNFPENRQVILQIWKPDKDLPSINGQPVSDDIPCNVMSLLKLRNGRLHWFQIMRSNDIMRGLPYNIIQFTMLQEVIAGWLGSELGDYCHLSDSLHLYKRDLEVFSCTPTESEATTREPFSLSYSETNEMCDQIYKDLSEVSKGDMKEAELIDIFDRDSKRNAGRCDLFKDIMAVIGSDAASREKHTALAFQLVDSCEDRNLKRASLAWLEYREGRK